MGNTRMAYICVIFGLCVLDYGSYKPIIVSRWAGVGAVQEKSIPYPLLKGCECEHLVEVSTTCCCRLSSIEKVLMCFLFSLQHLE